MKEGLQKVIAVSAATVTMGSGIGAMAQNQTTDNLNLESNITYQSNDIDTAINSLYQSQMQYLFDVQSKLRDFYENTDTKNIIKEAYPDAYQVAYATLNAEKISNGQGSYAYICKNSDLLSEISANNQMISSLYIKSSGSARDTDYGLIKDGSSGEYRQKTDEDKALIEEFMDLIDGQYIVSQNLIDVLNLAKLNIFNEDAFNCALEDIYQMQMNALSPTVEKLRNFYETEDVNQVIKNGYATAYEAAYTDLNYTTISYGTASSYYISNNSDLLDAVKTNDEVARALKIKKTNTGRDSDYGLIIDPNSENGIRQKTTEDDALIDSYSNNLENFYVVGYDVINCLQNIKGLQNNMNQIK